MTRTVLSGLTAALGFAAIAATPSDRVAAAENRPTLTVLYTVKNQAYLTTCG